MYFRIIWSVFILGFIGYFCYAFSTFLNEYSKALVNTKIKVVKVSKLTVSNVLVHTAMRK